MTAADTTEQIRQVRKHGHIVTDTRAEALALIAAAKEAGYRFAQQQRLGGFCVFDLDDPAEREGAARAAAERSEIALNTRLAIFRRPV